MDCLKFQDSLSDYVEGALDSRSRAECAGHRLVCRDCRELHSDVRAMMQALNVFASDDIEKPEGLDSRIIAATTTGEMLSCNEFDRLIERYFDGVLLAPTFQTFQGHFEKCSKCRRLMSGIEEAIEICHEIKQAEVDAPPSLQDRILAATVGNQKTSWLGRAKGFLFGFSISFARSMGTPQMVAALLIFAASSLLILSRFGSLSGMASHATTQAERVLTDTSVMAQRVSFALLSGGEAGQTNKTNEQKEAQVNPSPEVKPDVNAAPSPPDRKRQSLRHRN
jgi:anti-sigma factor RsiW